jgi:hypothetical protein
MSRITIITGHYGSGKTEFAVNLALSLADAGVSPLAVCDLDLVNPYFRSREQRELLESRGVAVHGSTYREEITAEIPALGASVRAPLEDKTCRVIVDAGGNDSGALVLKQFGKYFVADTDVVAVVNFSRYETRTVEAATGQIAAIERATGLTTNYIVNNTHLLRETTAETVLRGHALAVRLCEKLGKTLLYDCYPVGVVTGGLTPPLQETLFPLQLYMRPTWLDR